MRQQGPEARRIRLIALCWMPALALAAAGARAAGEPWSAPVNDATGKPLPVTLPATTTGFRPGEPVQGVPSMTPADRPMTLPRPAPAGIAADAPPSAMPSVSAPATASPRPSGPTGVPRGVTALPQIPPGDVLVVTARAPAPAAALPRRDLDRLNASIQRRLTPRGRTTISYRTDAITVRDTPAGEHAVEAYLAAIDRHPGAYGYRVRYRAVAMPLARAAAPSKPKPPYTLKPGEPLSRALAGYVAQHGWTLVWAVKTDYRLAAPLPIPAADHLIAGVSYVVRAYQAQGGLLGDTPVFRTPNHVVVIEPMTASMEHSQ